MKPISDISCPYCRNAMEVSGAHCAPCGITIHGAFQLNEFALLKEEDLHFLRIFLECEGRVREMEAPLGLSYPTIRNRLSALKEKILRTPPANKPRSVLEEFELGEISFDETLKKLKNKGEKK